jgi:hypothetical protein
VVYLLRTPFISGTQMHAHLESLFKARITGVPFCIAEVENNPPSEEILRQSMLKAFLDDHPELEPYR